MSRFDSIRFDSIGAHPLLSQTSPMAAQRDVHAVLSCPEIASTFRFASAGAAGMDLASTIDVSIEPHSTVRISTGVHLAIPSGMYGRVTGRSSMALLGCLVFDGVIDSDYRGPVHVVVHNLSTDTMHIDAAQRIAQIVFEPCCRPAIRFVRSLSPTPRGTRGFGSTGR